MNRFDQLPGYLAILCRVARITETALLVWIVVAFDEEVFLLVLFLATIGNAFMLTRLRRGTAHPGADPRWMQLYVRIKKYKPRNEMREEPQRSIASLISEPPVSGHTVSHRDWLFAWFARVLRPWIHPTRSVAYGQLDLLSQCGSGNH
jgi:hypothetical protein